MSATEKPTTNYLENTQRIVIISYYVMLMTTLNNTTPDLHAWGSVLWNIVSLLSAYLR